MTVTIKYFAANVCKLLEQLTENEPIVITRYGKKVAKVITLNDIKHKKVNTKPSTEVKSINLGLPTEEKKEIDPVMVAILEAKRKKQDTINGLQTKIDNIKPIEITDKHCCLQCKALGRVVEAVGEYEVVSDDGEHRCWLCRQHMRGRELERV